MTGRSKAEYLELTRLEREEFKDAAVRAHGGGEVMTGAAARDWMASQGG